MPEFSYDGKLYYNPVEFAMARIGGTWKMPILWRLQDEPKRYSELKRSMPRITDKMLSTELRKLEAHNFVHREIYAVVPPKTEYSLTDRGRRALRIIEVMREYGMELMEEEGLR